jgi:hypothetical protein
MSSVRPSSSPTSPASGRPDPAVHKRYLDYRERHAYFGNQLTKLLTMVEFVPLDAEHLALDAKGENARDDEDATRFEEVAAILFRD